jgi:inhibitor of the pro-sigma K processing machinery
MYTEKIMFWLIGVCVLMLLAVIFTKPFKVIAKMFVNCITGIATVFAVNFLLSPWNIAVGINYITALVCAIFGFPGTAMLFGLKIIFERIL